MNAGAKLIINFREFLKRVFSPEALLSVILIFSTWLHKVTITRMN
jgi:hypothetical protein